MKVRVLSEQSEPARYTLANVLRKRFELTLCLGRELENVRHVTQAQLAFDVAPLRCLARLAVRLELSHCLLGKLRPDHGFAGSLLKSQKVTFGHDDVASLPKVSVWVVMR